MPAHDTLLGLVEQYSPTGSEAPATEWLIRRMQELGYSRSFADEAGNAVGVMGDGENQIVLLGHIDTVPGEIAIREEGGVLYGRGTVDAKGPLAAFTDAVAAVGKIHDWQFVVIGAVEEEGESRGAWHIVDRYRPRYAFIGEPSGWDRLTLGYKGVIRFEYSVEKESGHTASGETSMCEDAVSFWNTLRELCQRKNADAERVFEQITPALREIKSGSDGLRDWAKMSGNIRIPVDAFTDEITTILQEATAGQGSAKIAGVPLRAYRAEKATAVVNALLSAIRKEGGKPVFSLKLGTSDLCVVGPKWRCPMVVYGPGDPALDHTPEECIVLEEYHKSVRILSASIRRLISG